MKKTFIYSIIILLAACLASCEKNEGPVGAAEGTITFAPSAVKTRALIEDAAGLQAQTFQVYDYLDGKQYIENTVSYASGAWTYGNEQTYLWKNGTHKFYGFTQNAGTLSANVLTVSKTLTTAEADQTDLLYSEVFSTTAAGWKADAAHTVDTPVALHMKHLLSAVSITLKNCTDYEASVTKVTAPAIPNEGSATVSYAGNAADVTYTTPTVSTSSSFVSATPINSATALASQKSIDVLNMAAADAKAYQLVWPQTLAKDAVTVTVSYTLNGTTYTDKTVALPADTWVAGKKYDYELQILPSDIRLVFVVQPWDSGEAGDIDTKNGSINMSNVTWMNTKVMVDGVEKNTVNNSGKSVTMWPTSGSSTFVVFETYENDVPAVDDQGQPILDDDNQPVILHHKGDKVVKEMQTVPYSYQPAQGYFTVNYPKAGLFKIGLIPAFGETTVDPQHYLIKIYDSQTQGWRDLNPDGEEISMNTVYFRVLAVEPRLDSAMHKAQIDILFKPAGEGSEWISAYSEIRANYAITIPATN